MRWSDPFARLQSSRPCRKGYQQVPPHRPVTASLLGTFVGELFGRELTASPTGTKSQVMTSNLDHHLVRGCLCRISCPGPSVVFRRKDSRVRIDARLSLSNCMGHTNGLLGCHKRVDPALSRPKARDTQIRERRLDPRPASRLFTAPTLTSAARASSSWVRPLLTRLG